MLDRRLRLVSLPVIAVLLGASGPAPVQAADLLLCDFSDSKVIRFDLDSGAAHDTWIRPRSGGLLNPHSIEAGPDGNLYVASETGRVILRYEGETGDFIDRFATDGLLQPMDLDYGPDGRLYVLNRNGLVLIYDPVTGGRLGTLVAGGAGGINAAEFQTFGPGGDLFVSAEGSDSIRRYDGTTGAFVGFFVASGAGGLGSARDLIFHTDGLLYVADWDTGTVRRYDGATGAFVDVFISSSPGNPLDRVHDLDFGPDGLLYVTQPFSGRVTRYDGTTGAFVDEFIVQGQGGITAANAIHFIPDTLRLRAPSPGRAGEMNNLLVTGGDGPGNLHIVWATSPGTTDLPFCPGLSLSIDQARRGLSMNPDERGRISVDVLVPSPLSGRTFFLQAAQPSTCILSNVVEHAFP